MAAGRTSPATWTTTAWRRRRLDSGPKARCRRTRRIVVYNGAEANLAETIAYLEKTFDVKVKLVDDPAIRTDIVITIGNRTPKLEAPLGA